MKTFKILFGISLIAMMIFISCLKDDFENTTTELNTNEVAIDNLNFVYNSLSDEDKIKVIVGEAVSSYLVNSNTFNDKLFSKLITTENKTKELLYIKEKDIVFGDGKSLENLLLEFYNDDENKKNLISSINTILPNLVLKISEWAEVVLDNENLDLEFAVYPCITKYRERGVYFRNGQMSMARNTGITSNVVSNYLPIQIEESERLIPVEKNTSTTFWDNDFYEDNFPFLLACLEFDKTVYTVHSNEIYDFVDKIALNEDLINGRLCTIDIDGANNNPQSCEIVYERDCRNEKNVIEGFKLANLATFIGINNQPGGEDVISLHYQFSVASMCGDLSQNEFCPPSDWKFVFFGRFFDFFELQAHSGYPLQSELSDVYFIGNGYYLKAFPIYYDIPVNFSEEGIYSQARYLPLAAYGTWDGNKYGDAIALAIYEHDDITVGVSQTNSISITNTTKVSAKLTIPGGVFESGADFSSSVTRSSSTTITIDASKDVELGKTATNYYHQNFTNSNIGFGYNVTTGAVNTHFAFYH
ncbi:MAG: hypothetical protein JKZ03_00470 [Flavobacteriaceae bacterium]|nr:hypothetical protein [Flavobacteriaceae bacterium]